MGDTRGRLNSPNGFDEPRSRSLSPLLGTETLPLDDQSICAYCHKEFRKPRVLDCLHSMCEDCIIAQLDGKRDQTPTSRKDPFDFELEAPRVSERPTPPGVIKCSICSQESHVGNDVRFVYQLLLDFVRVAESKDHPIQREERCGACKGDSAAIAVCKECHSALCEQCYGAHAVMTLFDGHNVTTYKDMDKNGSTAEHRTVMCHFHAQACKFLCANCETVGCKVCFEMEHKTHKVIEVKDIVVMAIQKELNTMVERMESKWKNAMSEWSSVPDRHASLHEQYEIAKLRLDASFEEVIKIVEELKAKKLAELEEARLKQEMNIEVLYKRMNLNESRVTDAITFTSRLLEKANGYELVASRQKVVQQLNNLFHTMPAMGAHFELQFQPISKAQMESQLDAICGNVVGRMMTNPVKEGHSNGSNGKKEEFVRPAIAPIGNERKKNTVPATNGNGNGTSSRQSNEEFGWPPSSNPPDLVPSPPILVPQQPVQPLQPQIASLTPADLINLPHDFSGMVPNSTDTAVNQIQQAEYIKTLIAQSPSPFYRQAWSKPVMPNQMAAAVAAASQNIQNVAAARQTLLGGIETLTPEQQASLKQLTMQAAFINNANNTHNQALLMQARLHGIDPSMINKLKAMSLAAPHLGLSQTLPDVAPQLGQPSRGSDLRVHSVFGTSNQGSSIRELHCPSGFCLSDSDDILIADTNNHRVIVCGPPHPWKIGRPGTDDGQLCFPRKVVALKGETTRYVVLDKGGDGKTRAQIFDGQGDFVKKINMPALVPRGGIEVSAATATPQGQLLLVDTSGFVFCIEVDTPRVVFWFDATGRIGEASDVAMSDKAVYITDFKHHCIQVFTIDGKFIQKMGEPSQTPYPIGIDINKNGNIMVADTHGNHLHVVVFTPEGTHVHSFTHNEFRLSRCVGLRIAKSGHIVTLCKHNHTLFVFKPLLSLQ